MQKHNEDADIYHNLVKKILWSLYGILTMLIIMVNDMYMYIVHVHCLHVHSSLGYKFKVYFSLLKVKVEATPPVPSVSLKPSTDVGKVCVYVHVLTAAYMYIIYMYVC